MTRITTHGRDSWTGRNAEQNARLIRDMPIVPMDEPEGIRFFRGLTFGLGAILAFYAIGVAIL